LDLRDPQWGLTPPPSLIGAQKTAPLQNSTLTYADILPDVPGLEKIEFESGFNKPTVNNQWAKVVGRMFAWRSGAWQSIWTSDPIDLLFIPLPIAGDFDGDGQPEIAVLPWKELLILDARSGRVKDRCTFTEGRSYGALYTDDLEGDGRQEFVVVADFCKHLDVLGYRDGRLRLLWRREIELAFDNPVKMLRAHPHPLADVNGDGHKELLINLFNDGGDRRWHLLVFDALRGDVLADCPDEFMQGLTDLDGDGLTEVLTTKTHENIIPSDGTILVRRFKGNKPSVIWQTSGAGWQMWEPPMPLKSNSAATLGHQDVLLRQTDQGVCAVLRRPSTNGQTALALARWQGGQFKELARVRGPMLAGMALDQFGRLFFRSSSCLTRPSAPAAEKARLIRGASRNASSWGATPPVVALDPSTSSPVVIVQSPAESLVAMEPTGKAGAPVKERWRVPGRGQGTDWPNSLGPVIADLAGDGRRQVLYASRAPSGVGRLNAMDLQGRELWHHDFPGLPGSAPVWNTGGVLLWQAGHFSDPRCQDVLVTTRRNIMHSDETFLLSGRDGRELWHRAHQISGRGVGGQPFAIADFDGDGLEDAASFYPSLFYILHGPTGKNVIAMDASWPQVPAKPVYSGVPIAGDFTGQGRASVFFASGRHSMTGLVQPDGRLAWFDTLNSGEGYPYPAFGDFDGDGKWEAIAAGYADGLHCYDCATGKIKWRLAPPAAGNLAGSASADLNGDGRDEAILVWGDRLYCVGCPSAGTPGALLWQIQLPATLGLPAITDVSGDGHAAILVGGADGFLYCVR